MPCPLRDVSISGLISEGLLLHTWPVCVSRQGTDMSRQMLCLHSGNTICEQRLKNSTAFLGVLYCMYFHFAKMYNRRMNFETVTTVLALFTCVNVSV